MIISRLLVRNRVVGRLPLDFNPVPQVWRLVATFGLVH
jgi:hypothetical protein